MLQFVQRQHAHHPIVVPRVLVILGNIHAPGERGAVLLKNRVLKVRGVEICRILKIDGAGKMRIGEIDGIVIDRIPERGLLQIGRMPEPCPTVIDALAQVRAPAVGAPVKIGEGRVGAQK